MADKKNKIITIVLSIIILIAIFTIIYVNLPEEKDTKDKTTNKDTETIFTITFGDEVTNYTLQDLEIFESFIGKGMLIRIGWLPEVKLEGPFNFTGIKVDTIINQFDNLPNNYTVSVYSSDGKTTDYNKSTINGQVKIYNESGNITQTGGVTMILAHKKDGAYLTDPDKGPLRIAFINDGKITSSKLWAKMVVSIEIIEQL